MGSAIADLAASTVLEQGTCRLREHGEEVFTLRRTDYCAADLVPLFTVKQSGGEFTGKFMVYVDLSRFLPVASTRISLKADGTLIPIRYERRDVSIERLSTGDRCDVSLWQAMDLPPDARPLALNAKPDDWAPAFPAFEQLIARLCAEARRSLDPQSTASGLYLGPNAVWGTNRAFYLLNAGWFEPDPPLAAAERAATTLQVGRLSLPRRPRTGRGVHPPKEKNWINWTNNDPDESDACNRRLQAFLQADPAGTLWPIDYFLVTGEAARLPFFQREVLQSFQEYHDQQHGLPVNRGMQVIDWTAEGKRAVASGAALALFYREMTSVRAVDDGSARILFLMEDFGRCIPFSLLYASGGFVE